MESRWLRHILIDFHQGKRNDHIHCRAIRSLSASKVLEDCIMDEVSDDVVHRPLKEDNNIMAGLTMNRARKLFEVKGPDVVEVYP